jgi:cytochrome c553
MPGQPRGWSRRRKHAADSPRCERLTQIRARQRINPAGSTAAMTGFRLELYRAPVQNQCFRDRFVSMSLRGPIIFSLAVTVFGVAQAADSNAGKAAYGPCVACHGVNAEGNPALNAPALASQSAAYLARQLRFFRNGVRGTAPGDTPGAQMVPMAALLADDAAIDNVAAYLASLPAARPTARVDGDAVAGNKHFQSKCGACHGTRGQGNDALNAPKLVGIGDAYLVRQVKAFQQSLRGAHADDTYGKQMQMMSVLVDDEALDDIAAFLNEKTPQQ